jgi:hypothetical protein
MNTVSCPRCGRFARQGTRFCEVCGTPIDDNTTRYLCAAVHQYENLCDATIAEYLVEPVRAVPPSPGADTGAVLRDAIAARFRRKVRDATLLVLLLIFVVTNPTLFTIWLLAVLLPWFFGGSNLGMLTGAVAGSTRPGMKSKLGGNESIARTLAIVIVGGMVLLYLMFVAVVSALPYLRFLLYQFGLVDGYGSGPGMPTISLVLVLLMFAVLLTDTLLVFWLVHTSFRRSQFAVDATNMPAGLQATLRLLGQGEYHYALRRVADADQARQQDGQADVIVHRGFSPFVGAGAVVDWKSLAITLSPRTDRDAPKVCRVDVLGLHDRINDDLWKIRGSASLGPGGRMADLGVREQLLIPAEQMFTYFGVPPQPDILPSLNEHPKPTVDVRPARDIAKEPAEWARYYRCYRVETWNRDLGPSCYVHVGADDTTLYVERVHCVLMPIADRIRKIDRPAEPVRAIADTMMHLILLPASTVRRIRTLFGVARRLRQRPGEVTPDRYGAGRSLRELASATTFRTHFQDADAVRYHKIIDRVLQRAIGAYLEDHGYSAVEFQRSFERIVNDFRYSRISKSAFGDGARVENNDGARQQEEQER